MLGMLCTVAGLALAALAAAPGMALAQNAVIRGTVRADNGEAVVGANVYIVELAAQGATNDAGRFVLTIPGDRVRGQQLQLRVRAIGYRPSSRPITISVGEQTVAFTLATDVNRLDEIVVSGVMEGTERARLPFTVATVDMADVPVVSSDPLRMLAGRVPGANITSGNGRPGGAPAVILRGPHSINAVGRSQEPLYIVDGIAITGSLPDINPADIENIEVVKGAAASSLYGARAGNGVITITTRSGRRASDGMSFNVRAETGGNDIEHSFNPATTTALLMDATNTRFCTGLAQVCATTVDWNAEALRVNNPPGDFASSPQTFTLDLSTSGVSSQTLRSAYMAQLLPGRTYNVVGATVQPQTFLNTTLDMTGRFANTTVFASVAALDQGGSIRFLNGFQRYSARVNVDQRIGTNWTASLRTYVSRNATDGLQTGTTGGSGGVFFLLTRQRAITNLLARDTLGRLFVRSDLQASGAQNPNPLINLLMEPDQQTADRFLGGLTLRFAPAHWVDLEGNFSYDLQTSQERDFRDKGYRTTSSSTTNNGFIFEANNRTQGINGSLAATFRANLTRDIAGRMSLRASYEQQDADARSGSAATMGVVGVPQLGNATTGQSVGSSYTSVRQNGYFVGAGLDFYNGRFGVDALVRNDGTSLYGSANRRQTFGRYSGYWNLALMPWWPAKNTLSSFKLRGSHGSAGGRPSFSAQYETWTSSSAGPSFGALGNINLRPEITTDNEVGADIELFRRALLTVTYDKSVTENQILQVNAPAEKGFSSQWQNAGTLSNRTWEVSLNLPVVQRRNVSWTWTFTADRTRTMIDTLFVPPFRFSGGTANGPSFDIYFAQSHHPYAEIWGRKFVTDCSELNLAPWGGKDFSTDCGGPTSSFQRNNDGFIVWAGGDVNAPNTNQFTWRDGITKNLWMDSLRATDGPWGHMANFGVPILVRDTLCAVPTPSTLNACNALQVPLGGTGLPTWQFSIGQNFAWRRLTVYALLQGVMGRRVWNEGRQWQHLDFVSGDINQRGMPVGDAKPVGYYWRAGQPDRTDGLGGFYDILNVNNYSMENTSYAKLRELAVSYNVGPVAGVGNWTMSVIGRNLFTISNYRGFDPEVGVSGSGGNGIGGSAAINAVDAFQFPNTRSFTFALQTSF
jgi:TonB-linked SusC/RagA family outer membrane protein